MDGVFHLVGGWRGSKTFFDSRIDDWDFLHDRVVRTLQHTSLAFQPALVPQRGRPLRDDLRLGRPQADRRRRRVRRRQGRHRGLDAGHGRLLRQGDHRPDGVPDRARLRSW
ncbi:hypothetical protein GCM10020229_68920 [Kitasatospora albolonga]